MKRLIKAILAVSVLLFSSNAFAKGYDWADCWCNYGGNIKAGDILVSVDGGIDWDIFDYWNAGGWSTPGVVLDVEAAIPVWKLPFTFGGFGLVKWTNNGSETHFYLDGGAVANYHFQLPPEQLDVYVSGKFGVRSDFYESAAHGVVIDPYFGTSIGATWFFSDSLGLNLELGYPFNRLGVMLKF